MPRNSILPRPDNDAPAATGPSLLGRQEVPHLQPRGFARTHLTWSATCRCKHLSNRFALRCNRDYQLVNMAFEPFYAIP